MQRDKSISFQLLDSKEEWSGWAEGLEICYVLRGKGYLTLSHKKQWQISENDVFVINMFEMYQVVLEPNGLFLRLWIPKEFVLNIYPETERLRIECFSFWFGSEEQEYFDRIRESIADIFRMYSKSGMQGELRLRGTVSLLLSELLYSYAKEREDTIGRKGREQLGMLMKYVGQHYREEISLSGFAEKSHYSASHLSHLMKDELGTNFTEYLKRIRLQNALKFMRQGKSITQISESVGFVNSNAFIKAFREVYGVTPGKYKSGQREQAGAMDLKDDLVANVQNTTLHVFDRLFSYLDLKKVQTDRKWEMPEVELRECKVNVCRAGNEIAGNWQFSVNGGYAKRLLYEQVQRSVCRIQKEIRFQYIRIKDIFNDELQICTRNLNEELVFNYVQLDYILDFLCANYAKPWIELSFMPSALSSARRRKGQDIWLIAMPDEPEEWFQLIEHLLGHLKERYGEKEVSQWIFTPFADIFLVNTHMQNKAGYYELYGKTHTLIRTLIPQAKIAARGTFEPNGSGLGDYMVRENILPDLWTMVNYNSVQPSEEQSELNLVESMEAYSMVISRDTSYLRSQITHQKKELEKFGIGKIPLILAEWNSTIWQRDLCSDTAYKACFLLKNVLENCNDIQGFTYWHISDWNDDYLPSPDRFHGGFGLFTRDNIPKAVYGALRLLGEAKGRIQAQGDGYTVLSAEGQVAIYLYNYCPYDMLYRYRHTGEISLCNRYNVFEMKNNVCYQVRLENMTPGEYQKKVYQIDRKEGSACDVWIRMGAPKELSDFEYDALNVSATPKCLVSQIKIEKEYTIQSILKPHTVQLIILQKKPD